MTTRPRLVRVAAGLLAAASLTTLFLAGTAAQAAPAATPADCVRQQSQQAIRAIDPRLARTNPREYARLLNQAVQTAVRNCVRANPPGPSSSTTPRPTTTTRPPTTTTSPSSDTPVTSGRAYPDSRFNNPANPNRLVFEGQSGGFSFICEGTVVRSSLRPFDPDGIITSGPTFQPGTFDGKPIESAVYYYEAPPASDPEQPGAPRYPLYVDGSCTGRYISFEREYTPPTTTPQGPGGGGSGGL